MGKRILLIDDDLLVIKSVKKALKSMGYEVFSAESGEKACEIALEKEIDLIISDIRMPKASGFEVLEKIRKNSQNKNKFAPAIMITGYNSQENFRDYEGLGITECLNKPFEIDELARVIKNNLAVTPHYERKYPRIAVNFSLKIKPKEGNFSESIISGKTLTISQEGASVVTEEELPLGGDSRVNLEIFLPTQSFKAKGRVIWKEKRIRTGENIYGLIFLDTGKEGSHILKTILNKYISLSEKFVLITEKLKKYVQSVKNDLDDFDSKNKDEKKQIEFLLEKKDIIFKKLTGYFDLIWEITKDFDKERYVIHKNYYQQELSELLLDPIETNKRIYQKPLGYPGDYIMMNCIFEYSGKKRFLGKSTYQKLINNYTCNIPISCSNVARKNFLKDIIKETIKNNDKSKIVSLGCGSARELTEVIEEGITKPVEFICLDLEEKALKHIKEELGKKDQRKKYLLSVKYIHKDIVRIIRDKNLRKEFIQSDLIYLSGIYDYLSDKMAKRLLEDIYPLVIEGGKLLVCNISLEKSRHRAYYELLGEWHMMHRTQKEMAGWVKSFEKASFQFIRPFDGDNYHFLLIKKEK